MVTNLNQRIERALDLRAQGYNCAQCVAMVYDDVTGLDPDLLARTTAGLGTGVGGLREVCGAVSAMAIVDSLTGYGSPADKPALYSTVSSDGEKFRSLNGSLVCRELKRPGGKPCPQLIADAVTILYHRFFPGNEE